MFQIDDPTAVAVMPTPEAAGTQGWFTEGNPATSTPATNLRASFFNGLTKELMNILAEAGATPSKTTYTQVRDAIYTMIQAKAIGYGQTWQNLTGSRALSTTYTNSTGRTIAVSVVSNVAPSGTLNLTVGGLTNVNTQAVTATNGAVSVSAIIPPGATYSVTSTNYTITQWNELR